ncbi:MAG: cob(I)yrinic acid a,c-diamide adenosyltransferase [Alphaproteobacteria bacterium]|jgi:cob(I)alamin adenosyltransferase|nr:cob(I)yrinic acid a,c-diamide adenosyltransferase [Alphaproteobacteria bacterium]MEE1568441.1 cob(I)yrinic acid a,c-diamide adenosyltransferase [Alphaproteobacteria bacterium]
MSPNDSAGHKAKMEKRKALHDKKLAGKTEAKGLLMVHTGPGKGKSSAAFGMALRCVGHNMRVGVVQFIKGAWDTGERRVLETFPELVTFKALGEGFTWETRDKERDIAAAKAAWEAAKKMITDPTYAMVILDEMNIALRYDYLDPNEVIDVLVSRRPGLHVVVTGRNAKPELIEAADLVTEMTLVKHPFRGGVKAQPGVEF